MRSREEANRATEVDMSSSSMSRRDGGAYRRAGLTVALALAALAVVPAMASAAAVSTSGTVITYAAASGETNNLTVTQPAADTYVFNETVISITESSANCTAAGGDVTCSGVSWTSVVVNLGDNNDTFTATGVNDDPFTIDGSSGSDTITASSANDVINGGSSSDNVSTGLSGGPGNDSIIGGSSTDDLNGNDGNDRLDGGDDSGDNGDDYDGGTGIDRVVYGSLAGFTYTCDSQPVVVTMDNLSGDDSCSDEDDNSENVRDSVESITGGTDDGDVITGSCFANTFAGDPGSANGSAGGTDTINGDPNTCSGGNGTDFMGGGEDNDVFDGDGTTGAAAFDTVTYGFPYTGAVAGTCSNQAVTTGFAVNLDTDNTNDDCDGFGNTSENVHNDIERIIGSGAADRINATSAAQGVSLYGRLGGDTLIGSGFGDFLDGESGVDSLTCLGGSDTYRDDENEDTVAADCELEI
jgi:RTX calcium-binding nonapeptide repeat (4 copies)